MAVGLNCALGAESIKPFVKRIQNFADTFSFAYPNAGLPNAMGGYDETPAQFAEKMMSFCNDGIVNMVGGCCGTTPEFIKAMHDLLLQKDFFENSKVLRKVPPPRQELMLSGLQEFIKYEDMNFINVGERCNIAGSLKFKRLICKESNYEEALQVAKEQVQAGA